MMGDGMADIQVQIQEKYEIDINKTNLFKLYKIENADISSQELEQKFAEARKSWLQGVNGANEKYAKRDAVRLENAEKYEAILRDGKLRKMLEAYYYTSSNEGGSLEVAKQYFSLMASSKHYSSVASIANDLELFFQCFPAQRKNKKAILEMLEKEYKLKGLTKGKNLKIEDVEQEEIEEPINKKKNSNNTVVNRFDKSTILKIQKCEEQLRVAAEIEELQKKESGLNEAIYVFLGMENIDTLEEMKGYVIQKREESQNNRQEKGQAYIPLVTFYNSMMDVLGYKDVQQNWEAFKLMLQYSKLTPYMYGLEVVKPDTLKQLYAIASQNYLFRDMNDFLIVYFQKIHEHFKMQTYPVKKMLDTAKMKTASNKVLNALEEKLGVSKGISLPGYIWFVHGLVYFPIFFVYAIFELFKFLFADAKRFGIIASIITAVGMAASIDIIGKVSSNILVEMLIVYGVVIVICSVLSGVFGREMCLVLNTGNSGFDSELNIVAFNWDGCDWIGIERTFQDILKTMFEKTKSEYMQVRNKYIGKSIPQILANILCIVLLLAMVWAL